MGYAAIVAAVVGLVTSVVGMVKSDDDRRKAQDLLKGILGDTEGIDIPKLTDDVIQAQQSQLATYKEDPSLRGKQLQALDALGREVSSQGMTAQDRAAYQRSALEAGAADAGFRGAAAQQAAARGLGGSMASYLSDLTAGQSAANREAMAGVQAASDSRERYLQALNALGGAAGSVRGQDLSVAQAKAAAQDAINRFNASQRMAGRQAMFGDAMDKQNALNGITSSIAGMYNSNANRTEARAGALGSSGGSIINGIGSMAGGSSGSGSSGSGDGSTGGDATGTGRKRTRPWDWYGGEGV